MHKMKDTELLAEKPLYTIIISYMFFFNNINFVGKFNKKTKAFSASITKNLPDKQPSGR